MNFDITECIPTGRRNAIRRSQLTDLTGLKDREIRRAIQEARQKTPIINLSDGKGYFLPDLKDRDDRNALKRYILQEEHRQKSVSQSVKAARKYMGGHHD